MTDVRIENHGTVFLFHLLSQAAQDWAEANIADEAQWLGGALAVEHRYAQDLAQGMLNDGLEVI